MKSKITGLDHNAIDRLRILSRGKVRKAYTEPPNDGITGLQIYDLRGPAARLVPVYSILRNRIPRRPAPRNSTGIHWKAITAINTGNILPGVSEGNRNAPIAQTTEAYFAEYAGMGMENYNTFEARYGSNEDVEALARLDALESLINGEERTILGGNYSLAFGTPSAPTSAILPTGGALTAQAWICYVVALTMEGLLQSSVAGGVSTEYNRTNADGSVDVIQGGSSNKSAASAATVATSGTQSILWKTISKPGAAGYAWYVGSSGGGTAARLAAITTVNEFLQTTNPSGVTQQASAITGDHSVNPLAMDGIITQIAKVGGSNILSLDGDAFTVNTAGTIDQLDELFRKMWEESRLGPTELLVNPITRVGLAKAVMAAGGGTPNIQVSVQIGAGGIRTGLTVESVLNPYTGEFVPFTTHPYMPKGMMVAMSWTIPYSIPGVRRPWEIETRQEYYSIKWPYRSRKDEFGVYVDEGLIGWTPFAHALIQDIGDE